MTDAGTTTSAHRDVCGTLTVRAVQGGTIVVTRADPRIRISAGLIDHADPDHVHIVDGVLEVWESPTADGPVVRYRLVEQIHAGDWIALRIDTPPCPIQRPVKAPSRA